MVKKPDAAPVNAILEECDRVTRRAAAPSGDLIDQLRVLSATGADASLALEIIARRPEFVEWMELQAALKRLGLG
jgi:hypothetical protein